MIRKPTWILIIILLIAIGAAVFFEKVPLLKVQVTPTTTSVPKLFMDWSSANLSRVFINGVEQIDLERNPDNTWYFSNVSGKLVHQGSIEQLLSEITALTPLAYLSSATSLDSLGLLVPGETITMVDLTGSTRVLKIGKETATGSGFYAQVDSNLPCVISQGSVQSILDLSKMNSLVMLTPTPAVPLMITPTP